MSKKPSIRKFLRVSSVRKRKPAIRNLKTRRTVRIRLVLVAVLLISIVAWGVYAFDKASEAAAAAAAEKDSTISSDLYNLPREVLLNVTKPLMLDSPGNYYFVKSPGNPPYYTMVEYDAVSGRNVTKGYVYVTTDVKYPWSFGYSGPISTLVSMDTKGVVLSVRVLAEMESRPGSAFEAPWLSTLVGKSVLGNYTVRQDIDSVSGATYTSMGVVNGIREAGRAVLKDVERSSAPPPPPPTLTEKLIAAIVNLTTPTDYLQSLALLALIGVSIVGMTKKIELLRYGVLLGSLLLMELLGTRMISIEEILNLRNLTLPPLQGNLFWYLLFGSAFFLSLIWGRVYCGWLCPFGAVTEFLNKLAGMFLRSKFKIPVSVKVRASVVNCFLRKHLGGFLPLDFKIPVSVKGKVSLVKSFLRKHLSRFLPFKHKASVFVEGKASYVKYLVLAAIVGSVLITGDLALTGVEPFATFFLVEGTGWMWLTLFAVLVASVRVNRAFCRYICPTGAVLSLAARLRVKEINRWSDCSTCRICQRDCSMGAIRGTRISATDCLNCGACERNYQDPQICLHWLRLRSIGATA